MSDNKTKRTTSKFYPQKKKMRNNRYSPHLICKCGGGQSCIVDRRKVGDWVHEDDVFKSVGLPLRKHCLQPYYETQMDALNNNLSGRQEKRQEKHKDKQKSLIDQWIEDSKSHKL